MKKIWFDMDGTIADLYGVENWLEDLQNERTRPYDDATTLLNMNLLARYLNKLQEMGFEIGIISWLSKRGSDEYMEQISISKRKWLKRHLRSVKWNHIYIVPHGTNKYNVCKQGILFDDEERNRTDWKDKSYTPDVILEVLKALIKGDK